MIAQPQLIKYYRGIKINCFFDRLGMVSWSIKYKGEWFGASGEYGLLQYAENAVAALQAGQKPSYWRLNP